MLEISVKRSKLEAYQSELNKNEQKSFDFWVYFFLLGRRESGVRVKFLPWKKEKIKSTVQRRK